MMRASRERLKGHFPSSGLHHHRSRGEHPDERKRMPSGSSNAVPASPTTMSRAEKFEDEKRRLIRSCFSKRDPDGSSM